MILDPLGPILSALTAALPFSCFTSPTKAATAGPRTLTPSRALPTPTRVNKLETDLTHPLAESPTTQIHRLAAYRPAKVSGSTPTATVGAPTPVPKTAYPLDTTPPTDTGDNGGWKDRRTGSPPGTTEEEQNWRERGWNSGHPTEGSQASGQPTEARDRPDPWDPSRQGTGTVVRPPHVTGASGRHTPWRRTRTTA